MRLLVLSRLGNPLLRLARQHRAEHLVQPPFDLAQQVRRKVRLGHDASGPVHDPTRIREEHGGLRPDQRQKLTDLPLSRVEDEVVQ